MTYVFGSVVLESVEDVGMAVPARDELYNVLASVSILGV